MKQDVRKDKTSWQADLVPLLFWNHETNLISSIFFLLPFSMMNPNAYIGFVILCKQNVCKYLVILWCRNVPFGPSGPCFGLKRRVSPLPYCFAQNSNALKVYQSHIPFAISPTAICVCAQSLQSCSTLCNTKGCSPPGSSVHGILWARRVKWVPCPSPGDLPNPGVEPGPPALQADSLLLSHQGSPHCHLPPH